MRLEDLPIDERRHMDWITFLSNAPKGICAKHRIPELHFSKIEIWCVEPALGLRVPDAALLFGLSRPWISGTIFTLPAGELVGKQNLSIWSVSSVKWWKNHERIRAGVHDSALARKRHYQEFGYSPHTWPYRCHGLWSASIAKRVAALRVRDSCDSKPGVFNIIAL